MTMGGRCGTEASRHKYDHSAILRPDPAPPLQRRCSARSRFVHMRVRRLPEYEETRNEFGREEAPQEDAEAQASQDAEEDALATQAQGIGAGSTNRGFTISGRRANRARC